MAKTRLSFCREIMLAVVIFACIPFGSRAADRRQPPTDRYGAPVIDAQGHRITYDRATLEETVGCSDREGVHRVKPRSVSRTGFVPASPSAQRPFWQYAIFGSGIGASNIVIGPRPQNGYPEIIIGGSSKGEFWANDFWHCIRFNPATGNYDQIFVSPVYTPREGDVSVAITRIALGHVTSTANQQIVIMLEDGRIYLYDFGTKAELRLIETGIPGSYGSGLEGLSVADLNGDGLAELIVTDPNNLYIFGGAGTLLWQVAGAGGYDVVAGQMDNDPAIEIASTNGMVVDASTHTVQWTRSGGFGSRLKLAPFAGHNYQQLIAAQAWDQIYSYDVAQQLPLWSISNFNTGAIQVADVDGDGVPELIIGDAQWGSVHVHDLNTQALKWQVNNPEHGVTNIAVADVDGDGVVDLLWGAGYSDTGPDYLYVANTTGSHDIKWQSLDLQGPFLGPAIGDLDGDGRPELVVCSASSNAGYDSGRLLVFDLGTLTLRGISAPVVDNYAWTGVHDLKLRDLNGNGRQQIVIGADYLYDGVVEIYRFDSNNAFTRTWTNATRPSGSPFNFVEVADLDNNGSRKIIAANYVEHTGSPGVYVYAYDYPSGAQSWRSVNLATGFGSAIGLVVQDLDGNGSKEIAALVDNGDFYTWDGPTRQLRNLRQATGGVVLSNRATSAGLVLGDNTGVGHFLRYANNNYTGNITRQLATNCDPNGYTPCFNGINFASNGDLWTGNGSSVTLRAPPSYSSVSWQSPEIGASFGRFVATAFRNGQNCVFSSAAHAVVGLTYAGSPLPVPCDFNRDGKPDYVLYNTSTRNTVIWYMNNNSRINAAFGPSIADGWNLIDAADFNRDGKPDYLLFKASTGQTAIWYMNNNVYLSGAYGPTLPSGWQLLAASDFNRDGKPDYVLYNSTTRQTAIWYMNNNVYAGGAYGPTITGGSRLVGVADFNQDGNPDYLLFNPSTNWSVIWYLNGSAFAGAVYGPTISSGYVLTGAADFDGDSKPDYVLFNPSTGRTAIWYLDNNHLIRGAYGPTLPADWALVRP